MALPSFLLELYGEEIPAKMQVYARESLQAKVSGLCKEFALDYVDCEVFVSPRRLSLVLHGVSDMQDAYEEVKGPRVGSSQEVLEKFCAKWNVQLQECLQKEVGQGVFWCFRRSRSTLPTEERLKGLCSLVFKTISWPKEMAWPQADISWIRPIRHVLCLYGAKSLIFKMPEFDFQTSSCTWGNPFSSLGLLHEPEVTLPSAEKYKEVLKDHDVWVCPEERMEKLVQDLQKISKENGYDCFENDLNPEGLLGEVSGLVQGPVVAFGRFSEHFLEIPEEFLLNTLKKHQRCFPLKDRSTGRLSCAFVVVLDGMMPSDEVIRGHERVVQARLWDALFFWNQDNQTPLGQYNESLKKRSFFQGLGSVHDKVVRLQLLAPSLERRQEALVSAACLSKADLATQAVAEFPDLQGVMGKHCALKQGIDQSVACAIQEQYWPCGKDSLLGGQSLLGGLLGILDRIDTLVGFFALGKSPTGSKDPMALRRAASGLVRLILHHKLPLLLPNLFKESFENYRAQKFLEYPQENFMNQLLEFCAQRLLFVLEEEGIPLNCAKASVTKKLQDSLCLIRQRALFLKDFLGTSPGKVFLLACRRAYNLLNTYGTKGRPLPKSGVMEDKTELSLCNALSDEAWRFSESFHEQDMRMLEHISCFVHAFLDDVRIEGSLLQEERLGLLESFLKHIKPLGDITYLMFDKE